jgi:hypothetical protein
MADCARYLGDERIIPKAAPGSAPAPAIPVWPRSLSFRLTPVTDRPLNNGLHAGTMLAIEVRAHHEPEQATVVMVSVAGAAGTATIPPPARLFWPASREISTTITQGASNFIM